MSGDIASAALRHCPREEVSLYDRSPRLFETRLSKQLRQVESSENVFRREFKAVRHVLLELGACASDLVWRRTLLLADTGRSLSPKDCDASVNDIELTVRDIIKNCVFSMPNLDPSSRGFNVTPKFARLMQILKSCEPYGESFRGIVFGLFIYYYCE
jgi:endoribonuclease Dicer